MGNSFKKPLVAVAFTIEIREIGHFSAEIEKAIAE
jgi:hypothetical protein